MSRLFPELEGRRPRESAAAAVAPNPTDPMDYAIVGGRRSLRAFSRVLALPGPFRGDPPCSVRSITLDPEDGICLTVAGGPLPETKFWIQPRGRTPVFKETAHLAITYRGTDLVTTQASLLEWASRALEPLRMDELERVIRQDPGSIRPVAVESAAGAPKSSAGRALSPLIYGYGAADTWLGFFADNELERSGGARLGGKHVQVLHTEIECLFGSIPNDDGGLPFFALTRSEHSPLDKGTRSRTLFTDLDDMDVIKGGTARLDQLMDTIAQGEAPDLVSVGTSCTPLVTGDDVEGAIGRLQARVDSPVMYLGNSIQPHIRLIQKWAAESDAPTAPHRGPGSADIVGLPGLPGRTALLALLGDADIDVRTTLIPDIDPAMLDHFGQASVQVYFRTDHHVAAYDALRAARPGPAIAPPVPFGVAGTRRWLEAIGVATGRTDEVEHAWGRAWERLRSRWERAVERAQRYRLGFVLDRHGLTRLERSCRMTGAPLVALLTEIGFGLDVLVHDPDGDGAPLGEVRQRLGSLDARVGSFRTPDELDRALRTSRAHAIYTEITMDPRPGHAGKARFSPRDLALGLDGIVDTAERLVALCSMSFFRTYSRHLTGAGEAVAPPSGAPLGSTGARRWVGGRGAVGGDA